MQHADGLHRVRRRSSHHRSGELAAVAANYYDDVTDPTDYYHVYH
jgi:hypothetical protein